MHDYFELWRTWGDGQPTADLTLWGLKVLWWGRIGKMAQFIGAMTIILDLLDPERLRSWGHTIHSRKIQESVARLIDTWDRYHYDVLSAAVILDTEWGPRSFSWTNLSKEDPNNPGFLVTKERHDSPSLGAAIAVRLLIILPLMALAGIVALFTDQKDLLGGLLVTALLIGWVLGAFLFAVLIVAPRILAHAGGAAIDYLLVRPIAWVLDLKSQRPGQPVKWIGFVLIVVGFHFDLLAS